MYAQNAIIDWLSASIDDTPSGTEEPIVDTALAASQPTLLPTLRAYRAWSDGEGLAQLRLCALRITRDQDAAEEALSETFLDVRERLVGYERRARSGQTLPGFRTAEEVARYHRVQLRLRLQGRWRRHRPTVALYDVTLATPPLAERRAAVNEDALPLRFALCWTLADIPSRAAHKNSDWWWSMLLHALDIQRHPDLAGARNDPTEILDRLRVRLAMTRGMRHWLQAWADGRPEWQHLSVRLPEQRPDVADVAAILPVLHGAIRAALERTELSPQEATGLHKVLVNGTTVRTNLRWFGETNPRKRMVGLAETVGARFAA